MRNFSRLEPFIKQIPPFTMMQAASLLLVLAVLYALVGVVDHPRVVALLTASIFFIVAIVMGGIESGLFFKQHKPKTLIDMHLISEPVDTITRQAQNPELSYADMMVRPMTISLGTGIADVLLNAERITATTHHFAELRRHISLEAGVLLQGIHVAQDLTLAPFSYRVAVRDEVVASANCTSDSDMLETLTRHVDTLMREHISVFFGRQQCKALVEYLRGVEPVLMEDVGSPLLPMSVVYETWKLLLTEMVWLRDPVLIMEAMVEEAEKHRAVLICLQRGNGWDKTIADYQALVDVLYDPAKLAEKVRKKVVPASLRRKSTDKALPLRYLTLAPEFIKKIGIAWHREGWSFRDIPGADEIWSRIVREYEAGHAQFLRSAPDDRVIINAFVRYGKCSVPVYAYDEIPSEVVTLHSGVIGADDADISPRNLPAFPL
jgi:flagellar biosynthesis component FlhA